MKCPNCSNDHYKASPHHDYVECMSCGVLFYFPDTAVWTDEGVKRYYQSGTYRARNQQADEVAHQTRRAQNIIGYVYPPPSVFLDIGCSKGILMQMVKDTTGATAYGVDIDPVLACGVYADIADVPGSPDFVTMIHSLEHMPHPLDYLRQIHSKMADGGRILIEVPNGDIYSENYYRPAFRFPHLVMFSERSLRWTMEEAGFTFLCSTIHGDGGLINARHYYYLLMIGQK